MDQGMTTSTNAEKIEKRFIEALTKTTSGPATPWQILASSNSAFVASPDACTVSHRFIWSWTIQPLAAMSQPILDQKPKERQMSLSFADDPMRQALLQLLTYSPTPDEPADEDIEPMLGYKSSE
jgi:hypothetical protein